GSRQLLPVVGQQLLGLGLGLLGLLQVALYLGPTGVQHRVDAWEDPLPHELQQDEERDGPEDQLGGVRVEQLLAALGDGDHWVQRAPASAMKASRQTISAT